VHSQSPGVSATSKVVSMHDAVAALVRDGDTVAIEGFTHLICFAAGHEIVRQRRRNLTLARMTPDVIYDQMVAGGVADKLIFSWLGNPGVGSLHSIRRRIESHDPTPLEIEEYSHFGMVCRYVAGAANLPFFPIRSYYESDIPKVNPNIKPMRSPYDDGDEVYVVPLPGPGERIQISTEGGREPVWRQDGRELFYRSGDKVMTVPIQTKPTFRAGRPQVLFPGEYDPGYDVARDGQRFLMIKTPTESAPRQINVVLNWFEELKQRAATGKK